MFVFGKGGGFSCIMCVFAVDIGEGVGEERGLLIVWCVCVQYAALWLELMELRSARAHGTAF